MQGSIVAVMMAGFCVMAGIAGIGLPVVVHAARSGHEAANVKARREQELFAQKNKELLEKEKLLKEEKKAIEAERDKLRADKDKLRAEKAEAQEKMAVFKLETEREVVRRAKENDEQAERLRVKAEQVRELESQAQQMKEAAALALSEARAAKDKAVKNSQDAESALLDLKFKTTEMAKHIVNFEGQHGADFLEIISRRIEAKYPALCESIDRAKELNKTLQLDDLKTAISLAEGVRSTAMRKSAQCRAFDNYMRKGGAR